MAKRKAQQEPIEPDQPSVLRDVVLTGAELAGAGGVDGVRIANADLSALTATTGVRIVESTLERVDLGGGRLANMTLSDVRLDTCNLANVDGRGMSLVRVIARNCRLTGLQWTQARMRDVSFVDCRIDLAGFTASRVESTRFERCLLRESSLQEATLRAISFVDCDLSGVDFTAANVDSCEMRGCRLDGARGIERLRGLRMPWSDIVACAGAFAEALGITILDE